MSTAALGVSLGMLMKTTSPIGGVLVEAEHLILMGVRHTTVVDTSQDHLEVLSKEPIGLVH